MRIIKRDRLAKDRIVHWGNGESRRMLLLRDRMGYGLTDTVVLAGTSSILEYKNHLETCYCIQGEGSVTDLTTGEVHRIEPFTAYVLDKHEKHILTATTDMILVCVFSPGLIGNETHTLSEDGSSTYPAPQIVLFLDTDASFAVEAHIIREMSLSPVFFSDASRFDPNYHSKKVRESFDQVIDVDTHDPHAMRAVIRALKLNVQGVVANEDDMIRSASELAKSLGAPSCKLRWT